MTLLEFIVCMLLALVATKCVMQTFQKAKTMSVSLQKTIEDKVNEAEDAMTRIPEWVS